jgi:hypothetical protein
MATQCVVDEAGSISNEWEKMTLINGVGTTGWPYGKKPKIDSFLISYISVNSKWITDLHYFKVTEDNLS